MPKTYNTRKQRAAKLLKTVLNGPSFLNDSNISQFQRDTYRLFVDTWIIPEIKELIPELRKERDARLKAEQSTAFKRTVRNGE